LTPHELVDLKMDTKNSHMAKNLNFNTKEFKDEMYHHYKNIVKHYKKICSVCGRYLIHEFPSKKLQRILCLLFKGKREGNYAYL
jgi:hypothetical protein